MTQTFRHILLAGFAVLAITVSLPPAAAQATYGYRPARIEFTVDVAEDMNLYVEPRVPTGTEPLRGSFFITEGKIFPANTIPNANGDQFDPNAIQGSIGVWFCKGTFLVRGTEFDKHSRSVVSDQVYLLDDDKRSIATTGTEGAGTTVRPVIGGTGPFAGYVGEQTQEFLGFNKTGGVNLRVTVRLRKATNN
ncbi:MAG: hypothetical protein SFV54_07560 [Bryobacteraceae bacterium]|nr:hypothetical protein [Bryobacteraceae bacterium]